MSSDENNRYSNKEDKKIGKNYAVECGFKYEINIAMMFLLKALLNEYEFELGIERPEAGKLDDLLFIYSDDDAVEYYICLQAKHTVSDNKIKLNNILSGGQSDFSLVKYFFSFHDLLHENIFKGKITKNLIVYTNYELDVNDAIGQKMVSSKSWSSLENDKRKLKHLIEEYDLNEDILMTKNDDGRLYRFNTVLVSTLKDKVNDYNVNRVVRELINLLQTKKQPSEVERIVKPYWSFLTTKLFDKENNTFRLKKDILNCKSKDIILFIKKFNEEIDRIEKRNKGSANSLYECRIIDPEWNPIENVDFENVISVEDIENFLEYMVYAIKQPGYKDLEDLIYKKINEIVENRHKDDMDFYTDDDIDRYGKNLFHTLQDKVTFWRKDRVCQKDLWDRQKGLLCLQYQWRMSFFMVKPPYRYFTGRTDYLRLLRDSLKRGTDLRSQVVVLCGLPGIGKTELVRSFIQRYSHRFENVIMWIEADSLDNIEVSFKKICEELDISDVCMDFEDVLSEIFLKYVENKCLIVLDDVKDVDVVEGFLKMLPSFENNIPFVVVISNHSDWNGYKVVHLDVLSETSGELLMRQLLNVDETQFDNVRRFNRILSSHPLAINRVCDYVLKSNSADLNRHIELFKNDPMLKNIEDVVDELKNYGNLGFRALEVLGIMSYISSDVQVKWLSNYVGEDFDGVLNILKRFCMVTLTDGVLRIHRLIQTIVRMKTDTETVKNKTFELFKSDMPLRDTRLESVLKKRRLLIHLKVFMKHVGENVFFEQLYWWYGDCLSAQGDFFEQKRTFEKLLKFLENKYGDDSIQVGRCLRDINQADRDMKAYKEQYETVIRMVRIFEKHLGPDDLETVKIYKYLCTCYRDDQKYEEAKIILNRTISVLKELEEYEEAGAHMNTLGNVYKDQGDYIQSKKIHEEAMEMLQNKYGGIHEDIYTIMNNLASDEYNLGNYKKSRDYYKQVYEFKVGYFGLENLKTALIIGNLGLAEARLGNYLPAIQLCKSALLLKINCFGDDNVRLTSVMCNLGIIYLDLGSYKCAQNILSKGYTIRQKHYKKFNIKVAEISTLLGVAEAKSGNYRYAEEFLEMSLSFRVKHFGDGHYKIGDCLIDHSELDKRLRRYDQAEDNIKRALKIYEVNFGREGFKTSIAMKCLGDLYVLMGRYDEAKVLFEEALNTRRRFVEDDNFKMAEVSLGLNIVRLYLNEFDGLFGCFGQCWIVFKRVGSYSKMGKAIYYSGVLLGILGHHDFAIKTLYSSLALYELCDNGVFQTARTLKSLGDVYADSGRLYKAKVLMEKSLIIYNKFLKVDQPELKDLLCAYKKILIRLNFKSIENF